MIGLRLKFRSSHGPVLGGVTGCVRVVGAGPSYVLMSEGQAGTGSGDAPPSGSEVCSEEDCEPSSSRPTTHAQVGGEGLHVNGLSGM